MERNVPGKMSAIESVALTIEPRPVIAIRLRRRPRLNDAQISEMIEMIRGVSQIQPNPGRGYWVYPVKGADKELLERIVDDLIELAKVIM